MKPHISEILEHNGKTYTLPIPAKYRELLDCVRVLGVKDTADEDDLRLVGYKTKYLPEPDLYDSRYEVARIADELSKLTDTQVQAIGSLCFAFTLSFTGIMDVLVCIYPRLKEDNENED